jgi:predicted methyltransferase
MKPMRKMLLATAAAAVLSTGLIGAAFAAHAPGPIAAAVADKSRPEADSKRDADRKPGETMAFAGLKPGDKVVDFLAGSGYFTRMFSDVVGPKGHVYSVFPEEITKFPKAGPVLKSLQDFAAAHPNTTVLTAPGKDEIAAVHDKVDMVWISQNYHDLKDKFMGPMDTLAFDRDVYAALKPGGIFIVLDHVAAPGSPASVTEDLHRIDPAVVKREVEAAGFKFVGESKILANPKDPHTANVFDKTIRGHTDQFIYKFRKPRK